MLPFCWKVYPEPDEISWCANRSLTWEDFKSTDITGYGARTATGIPVRSVKMDSTFIIEARAIFVRDKSWVKDTSKQLLIHEQIHFDISELVARKLRQFFYHRIVTDKNYEKIMMELNPIFGYGDELNCKFDDETQNGRLNEEQSMKLCVSL